MSADGSPPVASLAPGFRFHPTDEELVSYYLKRKILAKPFAVDAICDVDLYKSEPWDLPGKSRIQSRDMEWYFFGSLDKKYSNRSKTNRATGQGYWKTTGKDRAVRRANRTVGMKKTLVFHVGRAPKGERTNWVMHEYRLEDEELGKAGVAQDAYVVCRIFQKNGPGPQNGAQYGAPFVEEEWEDNENAVIGWEIGGGNILMGSGSNDGHSELEGQHVDIQNESTDHPVGPNDDQNIMANSVDPNSLPSQFPINKIVTELNEDIYLPEWHVNTESIDHSGHSGLLGSPQSPPMDDYMELNDFAKPMFVEEHGLQGLSMEQSVALRNLHDPNRNNGCLVSSDDFDNALEGDFHIMNQEVPAFVENNLYLERDDIFNIISSVGQEDDNMLYFDAPNLHLGVEQDGYVEMTDFLDPMSSRLSDPDPLEELVAYFDATEDSNSPSDYSEFLDSSSQNATKLWDKVDGVAKQDVSTPDQLLLDADDVYGSSSLELYSSSGKQNAHSINSSPSPDVEYGHAPDKSIKDRLISMLGSISSPPALAAEPKAHGLNTAAPTSSSIRITAGMIHINGLGMNGSREPWSVPKNEEVGFLLSYDTTRADIHRSSSDFAQVGKMHCSSVSVVVRSVYCASFLSILFLAVVVKIGFKYLCQVN